MVQFIIKKLGQISNKASFPSIEDGNIWLSRHEKMKSFGEPAHFKSVILTEEIPAVVDENGVEVSPLVPATYKDILVPADYEVIIEDITAQEAAIALRLEAKKVAREALKNADIDGATTIAKLKAILKLLLEAQE